MSGYDEQGFCKPGTYGMVRHQGNPLTVDQVAALEDGTEIVVTWFGGNGPWPYRVLVDYAGDRLVESLYCDPLIERITSSGREFRALINRVTLGWDKEARRYYEQYNHPSERMTRQWQQLREGPADGRD